MVTGEDEVVEVEGLDGPKRVRGRFAAGVSGNPGGRPRGSRNRTSKLCSDLLSADAGEIIAKVIRLAKKGDGVALKLCVERLLPVRTARDRAVDLVLPAAASAADLVRAAAVVIEQAAAGEISLSEARDFMELLERQRRSIETGDLAVRIEALEASGAAQVGVRVRRVLDRGIGRDPELGGGL